MLKHRKHPGMKIVPFSLAALAAVAALVTGCKTTGTIAIPRTDGSGTNYYHYAGVGGVIRPGIMIVFAESGSNGPPVLAQGVGSPIAPSILGVAAHVGGGLALGSTLRPDEESTTTVIQGEPRAGPIVPPEVPRPSRPPFGPPPWHGKSPHNKGR